jgi:hypothetical protein
MNERVSSKQRRGEQQMNNCFAIVPDGRNEPVALFDDLEDAMEWGLKKFGGDRFQIRHISYVEATGEKKGLN